LKTQILQDTSASTADPHVDETASKCQRTNDRCTNKSQTAAHDKGIQRRSPEDTVERENAFLGREAVIKDVAVDVVDAVESREGDAPAGAHKVQLCRARLPVVEGDHDDARYVRERRVDEKLFGRCEELRLDAVRRRAEREECFGEQEDEFLPDVQGWCITINPKKGDREGGKEGEERKDGVGGLLLFTHEHGYSQAETVNALASTARRGLFLSRQTRPSSTAFGRRSKVSTLGA
jgi:hypothetical protein